MHPAPSDPKLPKPKGFPGVLVRRRCPHPARQAHPGTGLQGWRAGSPGPRQTHHTCRVPRSELQPPGADSRKRLKGTHRPRVKKSSGQTLTCKESPRKKEQLGSRGLQTSRPPIRFWGDGGRRRVQNQSPWRDCGWVPKKGPGRGGGLSPLPQQQDRAERRGVPGAAGSPGAQARDLGRSTLAGAPRPAPRRRGPAPLEFPAPCLCSACQECGQKARTEPTSTPSAGRTRGSCCPRATTSAKCTSSPTPARSSG